MRSSFAGPPSGAAVLFCLVLGSSAPAFAQAEFRRGDANVDGVVDIADVCFVIEFLRHGEPAPACRNAADADASGSLDVADAVFTFNYVFLCGRGPPAPGPDTPGPEPSSTLDCVSYDPAPPPARGEFTLGFECPLGITGAPGETVRFEAFATLTTAGADEDAVYILTFNFLGGPPPVAPFPACGPGGEADEALGCAMVPPTCQ